MMKPSRGIALLAGGVAMGLLLGVELAHAASGNADGTYTVTITKVEVSKDSGTTYTTIFSGSQDINIASVDAGAIAAGLANGVTVDAGTYTRVRVTIGSALKVKGYVNNGATTLYTNGVTFGVNLAAANTPGGDYAVSTFTIPANSLVNVNTTSITVQPGTSPLVDVAFDTSGVITQSGGTPSVGAPTVTVTSQ